MSAAEDIYRQALALPEYERRELAAKLVASLSHADFTADEIATFAESARAVADGSDPGVSWPELRTELRASQSRPTRPSPVRSESSHRRVIRST